MAKEVEILAHAAKSAREIEDIEIRFFGRKGEFNRAIKNISELPDKEKKEIGILANEIKKKLYNIFESKKELLLIESERNAMESESVDLSEPRFPITRRGSVHPITKVRMEMEDWFKSLGFSVLDGPELESEFYNFEALNMPEYHSARDTQDTFYIEGMDKSIMRTHTSSLQVRAMQKYGAPIRAIAPGRVFRNESTDASHEHTFDQLEGFMVDKNISITHLLGIMNLVVEGVFQRTIKTRLRPGHFNFVEPGFEMDIECLYCAGAGCSFCKKTGWVETVGCGLIHPKVLEYGKIDSLKFSGFAFGFGLTRLVLMKYGIEDIRLLLSGDLRFLKQF